MYRIEQKEVLLHHSFTPHSLGKYLIMRLEQRIQELCARVVEEKDSEELAKVLTELKEALREHRRQTAAIVFMHRKLFKDVA